jgi:hypothetical protein
MINMGKSLFRNADTDSIDTQLGHDLRSSARRTFDGIADAGYTLVRGVGKTVALTFAIAVGGTVALVAGTRLSEDALLEEQPVDIETFMRQYGIQGTPEEFIDKLLKDGTIKPELIPHAAPEGSTEPDPEVEKGQKLLPGEIVEPQRTLEV